MRNSKNLKGFTLIEILIVIGLIAILAAITVIALNPTENFKEAKNARRQSDLTQIMDAFTRWIAQGNDISGIGAPTCPPGPTIVNITGVAVDALANLTYYFPGGVDTIPVDPEEGGKYYMCASANTLTVVAPKIVDGKRMYITR